MTINNAFNYALQGVKGGQQQLAGSAQSVASAIDAEPQESLTEPLVALKSAQHQVEISARVIATVDDTLSSLLKAL